MAKPTNKSAGGRSLRETLERIIANTLEFANPLGLVAKNQGGLDLFCPTKRNEIDEEEE